MTRSFETPKVDDTDLVDDGTSSFSKTENLSPEERKQRLKDKALFSSLQDLPRTNFEQRKSLYDEVESFLFRGFLAETSVIDDISISMRSLSSSDLFFMKSLTYPNMLISEWKVICIAKSIWMWDGQILLENPNIFAEIRNILRELTPSIIDYLYSIYLSLLEKEGENQDVIEYFSLENYSRRLWKIYSKYKMNSSSVTGMKGTENLPLNNIQRLWIMYNQTQDEIDEFSARWDLVKANMSPHAHKEIKRLNTRDDAKKKDAEKRNQAQLDHFYYKKIGVLKDQEFIYKDALTRLKSVEELDKEYKNWVDGVKDSHDLIVHNWKMAIADKMRQEEERLETAQNDMFKFNYEESDERVKIIAYTTQQLIEQGIIGSESAGPVKIYDEAAEANKKKYVKHNLKLDGVVSSTLKSPKLNNSSLSHPPTLNTLDKLNK